MGLKNFGFIADSFVKSARERFLKEYYDGDRDSYDPVDIEKILNEDWYIKRFLIAAYKNEEDACKKLSDAMKWRKETGIRYIKDSDFPREFYETGALFQYEPDKDGNPSLIMRLKFLKRIPEMLDDMKTFCMHHVFKIDEMTSGNGWMLVMDFTGCGYSHYQNLDVCHFFISTMHTYFPAGMNYVAVMDLPWVLSSFWAFVKLWIPEKRRDMVRFCSRGSLTEFFDANNLPPVLGGSCKKPYKFSPEKCPSAFDLGLDLGLDPSRCEEIFQEFKPLLDEVAMED